MWKAAGDDAIRLLGAIDEPAARTQLVAEFGLPQPDATLDALVHALAQQAEPGVLTRVVVLGREAVGSRSGNLTYEQARRISAVSFYLLASGPDTRADGLEMLRHMVPADQADTAAWAVQTWCERAVRRPADRAAAEQARATRAAEFEGRNIQWRQLVRGSFKCGPPVD